MRRRIGLLTLAIFAFAIGSEFALQLIGLGARAWLEMRPTSVASAETITLLCVGDSHTYGASLPREDSYPAQLEVLLERSFPGRDFRVLNRGVPGVNSAFVANRLEHQILQHRPRMVLVWVGTNNRWNSLETEAWNEQGPSRRIHRALLHVKLYRLARVAWFSVAGPEDGVAERDIAGFHVADKFVPSKRRSKRLNDTEIVEGLAIDMQRMTRIAEALSTPILFITYPKSTQAGASEAIASTAERLGVPIVDSRKSLRLALAEGRKMANLIVYAAGPHPTRLLYSYVVEAIFPLVVEALEDSHGIDLSGSRSPNTGGAVRTSSRRREAQRG